MPAIHSPVLTPHSSVLHSCSENSEVGILVRFSLCSYSFNILLQHPHSGSLELSPSSVIMCVTFINCLSCGCLAVTRVLTCSERQGDQCQLANQQVQNVGHECERCAAVLQSLWDLDLGK